MTVRPMEVLWWAGGAWTVTVIATRPLIDWLSGHRLGKTIRADGPQHQAKMGTPTMGGLAALAVVAGAWLILVARLGLTPPLMTAVVAAVPFALLGLYDDLRGLGRLPGSTERGVGLTARRMFGLQVGVALVVATVARPAGMLWIAAAGLAILVVVGTANGVNLSDGLDGLAAGLLALAFLCQGAVIGLRHGNEAAQLLAYAVAGACLGFLVWNRHPARVFMGNVTSYPLGALLGALAFATSTWPWLALVGAVFAAEVVSDVLQVGYFKLTHGRRLFRMAPLHHHFELGGWTEQQIVRRFWIAGAVAGLLGIATSAFAQPIGGG